MCWNKDPLLSFVDSHIINYPIPVNLNYMWIFGSAAGICLVIQIVSFSFFIMLVFYTSLSEDTLEEDSLKPDKIMPSPYLITPYDLDTEVYLECQDYIDELYSGHFLVVATKSFSVKERILFSGRRFLRNVVDINGGDARFGPEIKLRESGLISLFNPFNIFVKKTVIVFEVTQLQRKHLAYVTRILQKDLKLKNVVVIHNSLLAVVIKDIMKNKIKLEEYSYNEK